MPTNFLYAAGTNGFTTTPFNYMTTELNSLASGNTAVSSVGGTSGVFTQSNTGGSIWAYISLLLGGAVTPVAPNYLCGQFILNADDTNYEKASSNAAPARADFIIPLLVVAYAANDLAAAAGGLVRIPASAHKVLLWSQVGAALPASGNKLICGPVAIQY